MSSSAPNMSSIQLRVNIMQQEGKAINQQTQTISKQHHIEQPQWQFIMDPQNDRQNIVTCPNPHLEPHIISQEEEDDTPPQVHTNPATST